MRLLCACGAAGRSEGRLQTCHSLNGVHALGHSARHNETLKRNELSDITDCVVLSDRVGAFVPQNRLGPKTSGRARLHVAALSGLLYRLGRFIPRMKASICAK